MVFLLFTTQSGQLLREQILRNYMEEDPEGCKRIFNEARSLCDTILKKLEKFVSDNASRMGRGSSHKFLTLLLNPLEESIKLCGSKPSDQMPDKCRERVNTILTGMKQIFKLSSS